MAEVPCGKHGRNLIQNSVVGCCEFQNAHLPDFPDSLALTICARSARMFRSSAKRTVRSAPKKWACGAAGSALPWHGRGRRFDPDQVHQISQQFRQGDSPPARSLCLGFCRDPPSWCSRLGFPSQSASLPPARDGNGSNGSTNPVHAIGFSVYLGQLSASTIFATARLLSSRRTVRRIQRSWRLPDTSAVAC